MSETTLEGIGVPVSGEGENYLLPESGPNLTIASLCRLAGAEVVRWSEATAFTYEDAQVDDLALDPCQKDWQELIDDYRQSSGRRFPQVYRFKITMETAPLSDEESEAFWRKKQAE